VQLSFIYISIYRSTSIANSSALVYQGASNKGLIAYTDSDYAADLVKCQSMTCYLLKLANGIISWQSRVQKTIVLSATEAKYMALSDCS